MPSMNTCFVPWKGRERYSVSCIIGGEWRRLLRFFGHVTILFRAENFGGPSDHWVWMFWWSDMISGGLGPPSVSNADHTPVLSLSYLRIMVCFKYTPYTDMISNMTRGQSGCLNVPQNCLKVPGVYLKVPWKCFKVPPPFSGTYCYCNI